MAKQEIRRKSFSGMAKQQIRKKRFSGMGKQEIRRSFPSNSEFSGKAKQERRGTCLPEELVREVLLRVPLQSLLIFKSVSKEWYTLINDPLFSKSDQLQLSKSAPGIISESSKPGIFSYFNLEVEKEGRGVKQQIDFNIEELVKDTVTLRDSCNGLLLLQRKNSLHQFYVCNPITRWHLKLPEFLPGTNAQHLWSSLAYDKSIHKYKVVITFRKSGNTVLKPASHKCGVFTLGNKDDGGSSCGSWRELDMPAAYRPTQCQPLSVNGVLHWMAYTAEKHGYILLMDLASEEFRVMTSPVPPTPRLSILLEMKGCLCLSYPVSSNQLDFYVLNDPVKQAWSKQFSINLGLFIDESYPQKHDWVYPLVVRENSRPVITFLCSTREELIIYDLDKELFKVESKGIDFRRSTTIAHINSLITC